MNKLMQKLHGLGFYPGTFEWSLAHHIDTKTLSQCLNVYVDLDGTLRPRKNPTTGLYLFDGQIFFRKNSSR